MWGKEKLKLDLDIHPPIHGMLSFVYFFSLLGTLHSIQIKQIGGVNEFRDIQTGFPKRRIICFKFISLKWKVNLRGMNGNEGEENPLNVSVCNSHTHIRLLLLFPQKNRFIQIHSEIFSPFCFQVVMNDLQNRLKKVFRKFHPSKLHGNLFTRFFN